MNRMPETLENTRAVRRSQPQRITARLPFLLGSAGHFLAAAVSVPFGVVAYLTAPFLYYANAGLAVLPTVFAIALLLQSSSFYGMWRSYGSKVGDCAFGCGLVSSLFLLITGLVASGACAYRVEDHACYRSLPEPYNFLVAASYVQLGAAFIVEGYAFLKIQRHTREPGNASITGELYVIAGVLFVSILGTVFGGFMVLMIAFIFGGIILARAPIHPSVIAKVASPVPPAGV